MPQSKSYPYSLLTVKLLVFFALSRSGRAKAARKMLMKLNEAEIFGVNSLDAFLVILLNLKFFSNLFD